MINLVCLNLNDASNVFNDKIAINSTRIRDSPKLSFEQGL